MEGKNVLTTISAARLVASVFGVLSGLGGITHGVGETLQGNVAPDGIVINSWTQGPIATNMGGEPAMTIVPNLFITGVLTIVISLAVMVWAVAFVQRKNGGAVLILLSIVMLLVGGGFGPPIIGILAGIAGTSINAPLTWWRTHLSVKPQRFLIKLWPWVFGACLTNGVFLFLGSIILVYFFGMNNPDLFLNSFFFAIGSLLLTIVAGFAHDSIQQEIVRKP